MGGLYIGAINGGSALVKLSDPEETVNLLTILVTTIKFIQPTDTVLLSSQELFPQHQSIRSFIMDLQCFREKTEPA